PDFLPKALAGFPSAGTASAGAQNRLLRLAVQRRCAQPILEKNPFRPFPSFAEPDSLAIRPPITRLPQPCPLAQTNADHRWCHQHPPLLRCDQRFATNSAEFPIHVVPPFLFLYMGLIGSLFRLSRQL